MHINSTFYLLRWRFDFQGGISRTGMWSDPGNIKDAGAWKQTRSGLILSRAFVEGKNYETRVISALADCDGQDFMNFEWMALAKINPFERGQRTPTSTVNGLAIVTRYEIIRVMIDGQVIREKLPDSHNKIHFSTFGK